MNRPPAPFGPLAVDCRPDVRFCVIAQRGQSMGFHPSGDPKNAPHSVSTLPVAPSVSQACARASALTQWYLSPPPAWHRSERTVLGDLPCTSTGDVRMPPGACTSVAPAMHAPLHICDVTGCRILAAGVSCPTLSTLPVRPSASQGLRTC